MGDVEEDGLNRAGLEDLARVIGWVRDVRDGLREDRGIIGSVYHALHVVAAFLHFRLSTELHTSTARLPHASGRLYLKFSDPIQHLVPVSCGCIRLGKMKLHNLYLENEYGVPPSKLGPTSASCLLSGTAYRRLNSETTTQLLTQLLALTKFRELPRSPSPQVSR
jgi:hypothetical protein